MRENFEKLYCELREHHDVVLAVIVAEEGSSPRGTGAMMLVNRDGRVSGTIGGGAVEKKAEELAQQLLKEKTSATHEFILRKNPAEDIGMACGGNVKVLFQYISAEDRVWEQLTGELLKQMEKQRPGWLILHMNGQAPSLLDENSGCIVGSASVEKGTLAQSGCISKDSAFLMPLPVGNRAVIFGGGHIAAALAPLLKSVGFRIVVFDDRAEYSNSERFPMAERTICGNYSEISRYLTLEKEDYVVVITDGHRHDFEVEKQALPHPLAYIGVIGSKTKTAAVNQRLLDCGFSENDLKRIHAPIGTKIKAVTPAEIAVSIAGEMILVRAENRESDTGVRGGCPMR